MDIVRKGAKRNRLIRRGIVLVGLVIAGGVLTGALARLEPALPTVDLQTVVIGEVKRGQMLRDVRANGSLVPIDKTWITAETNGRIVALPLKPGTRVTPDTVIIKLSNPELEKELEDAKWKLASAEATVVSTKEQLQNQLLDLKSQLAQFNGESGDAQLQVDVDAQLFNDKLISGQRYKLSKGKAEQLKKRLEIATEKVDHFETSIEPQLAVHKANVAQAEAALKLKQRQFDNLEICAGISGILQQLGATPNSSSNASQTHTLAIGQWILSGAPLAVITDPTKLQAELRVPEVQARDILLDQPVEIDARVAKIKGTVIRIDPGVNQGTVVVDVRLDGELPNGARPDLTVDGTILIERLDDVFYTQRMVFGEAGSTVGIFKLKPDQSYAERVRVTLGRNSVHSIEIVSGLDVGDKVICSDMQAWQDHDRIRLQ